METREERNRAVLADWIRRQPAEFSAVQAFADLESTGITSAEVVSLIHEWHGEKRLKRSAAQLMTEKHYLRGPAWDL